MVKPNNSFQRIPYLTKQWQRISFFNAMIETKRKFCSIQWEPRLYWNLFTQRGIMFETLILISQDELKLRIGLILSIKNCDEFWLFREHYSPRVVERLHPSISFRNCGNITGLTVNLVWEIWASTVGINFPGILCQYVTALWGECNWSRSGWKQRPGSL